MIHEGQLSLVQEGALGACNSSRTGEAELAGPVLAQARWITARHALVLTQLCGLHQALGQGLELNLCHVMSSLCCTCLTCLLSQLL